MTRSLSPDSDPARVALLVIFLFVLPVVLLFLTLRFPRCRRGLICLGSGSPFHKAAGRQQSRYEPTVAHFCSISLWFNGSDFVSSSTVLKDNRAAYSVYKSYIGVLFLPRYVQILTLTLPQIV